MKITGAWIAPCLFTLLLFCAAVTGPAAGVLPSATPSTAQDESGEPPQAVAGLDQTVERNASVLLDATQSFSPDGELVDYEWTITSPSGDSLDPTCDSPECGLAHFRAADLGEYTVTLTVTDDGGQAASDTLYVTVVPRGDFGVELSGPSGASGGDEANLTATISPGSAVVENVTWYRGEQEIGNQSVPELGGVFNRSVLIVPGTTYRAVVADQWNQTVSDTWNASGNQGSWTPESAGSDEYPRIEGPAVVTGSPDAKTDEGWKYEDVSYEVQTSEHGTVTKSLWVLDNGHSDDFNANAKQVDLPLYHGVNAVTANLDLELEQLAEFAQHNGDNATALHRTNSSLSTETVLNRHVVVDPAPEVKEFSVSRSGGSIQVRYFTSDVYNPVESMNILVGDSQVVTDADVNGNGLVFYEAAIPEGEYGETSVTLELNDGRQTVTRTGTVLLPPNPENVRTAVFKAIERLEEAISTFVNE